jgi:hypothetical protein
MEINKMKQPKFTPAPWHRNINAHYPIYAGTDKTNWIHICGVLGNYKDEEVDANYKLITTAPEMYEALEKIKTELERYHGDDKFPNVYNLIITTCENVLKKARGE